MDLRFLYNMEKKPNIGVVAGAFPILHPGYVRLFEEALDNCGQLIVLLHEDPTIERPEKVKPILTAVERKEVLNLFLPYNSVIITYNIEQQLSFLLRSIDPDVRFLGDDYQGKSYTGDDLGIPVHWIKRNHGWSSTKFIKEIAESINGKV